MQLLRIRNLALLVWAQGLTATVIAVMVLSCGLVGLQLAAETPFLATLPVGCMVLGQTMSVYSLAGYIQHFGARLTIALTSLLGAVGGLVACIAIWQGSFIGFCLGALLLGAFTSLQQYFRFIATDLETQPRWQKKAISLVLSGGLIGAFLGPFIGSELSYFYADYPFLALFVAITLLCLILAVSMLMLQLPSKETVELTTAAVKAISWQSLIKQPLFVLSTASCALGFAVMVIQMNAAPLDMLQQQFSIAAIATVIQWHVVGMFAPAVLLVFIADKFNNSSIIAAGIGLNLLALLLTLVGDGYWYYWLSLVLVGVGWALMFNGGTYVLAELKDPLYRTKLRGLNSFFTYICNAIAAVSAGSLIALPNGRLWLNLASIAMLIISGYVLVKIKLSSARAAA